LKAQGRGKREERRGDDPVARVLAAGGRVPKKFVKARPVSAGPTLGALEAQAKVSAARRVAFEILMLVEAGKGHSDDLLRGPRMEELSEADKHLATALVMGVLRWQIALDAGVRRFLERPDQKIAEPVAMALRMGAFQLLHMDRIPAHAALSESVELCRAAGQPHATGMVNAILRKVATAPKPKEKVFELPAAFAERLGHPAWLVERWVKAYGRAAALKICEADQQEPGRGGLFVESGEGLPEIDDGSRLVAEIAAAAAPAVEGRALRVWDCCAAPGGKTLVMAARLAGAEVLATDVSAKRLAAMQGRLRRYPYAAEVKTAVIDAAKAPASVGEFDLILCDVPCSGTGTLGRNPEIRLRLQPEELARQAARQQMILSSALKRLAVGGRLVYSTCSLEPEECEAVVSAVASGYRRVDISELVGKVSGLVSTEGLVTDGVLRTLPGVCDCDGFYAVVLERETTTA
jgi:16S rRNA (cytosine967-C5)-methyltransferase